ncbi:ThiF family adenylyltransferase [Nocardia brasiliensis]|uniref:ThiF family adenylyltransferase n=1 Tax=Nocardia brasiliensis TaxID=37326 RepID=UPI00245485EA|nr:ThiF family adenylyltransferase [Nocardia brasiliensis]
MTAQLAAEARHHLLRSDGQEDICLATYAPSTGSLRTTAVLNEILLPLDGERTVHGNATVTGRYIVRAASHAAGRGLGIALIHSHPDGCGWQFMSRPDQRTEQSYSRVATTITGLPLLGMTLSGDSTWSARLWSDGSNCIDAESIRTVGKILRVDWNDALCPPPPATTEQVRTISAWGPSVQADLARLNVLVVGVGTVGIDLAIRLVQAGVQSVSVMDFDTVETINLDRLLTATFLDAALGRSKIDIAMRAMRNASTSAHPRLNGYDQSICEPDGLRHALDHDVIFSSVDRPWARAVLNQLPYSDLIPVIDGGIAIDTFPDQSMRNATWRAHVITAGTACLQCIGQIDGAQVARDRTGLLDDETYIKTAGLKVPSRENVSLLALAVTASMLGQFVSLFVAPGGRGIPDPLRYSLATHTLEHLQFGQQSGCAYEHAAGTADQRPVLTGPHPVAEAARRTRASHSARLWIRTGRRAQALCDWISTAMSTAARYFS